MHDDCVCVNWKLAVLERFVERKYGSLHSATIHTKNGVTNRPVSKLYPLEVTANNTASIQSQVAKGKGVDEDDLKVTISELTSQEVNSHPKCRAAEQARQQIMQWLKCIHAHQRMSKIVTKYLLCTHACATYVIVHLKELSCDEQ